MVDVLVVLVTDEFRNFLSCWSERRDACRRPPRFLEGARVVKCGFNFEVTQIGPPYARCHMEFFGVRYGFSKPCLVLETDRVDHQRISVPGSDEVSGP